MMARQQPQQQTGSMPPITKRPSSVRRPSCTTLYTLPSHDAPIRHEDTKTKGAQKSYRMHNTHYTYIYSYKYLNEYIAVLGEMSKFIGCSPHIQQPAAANLHKKSYTSLLNAFTIFRCITKNCLYGRPVSYGIEQ